MGGTTSKHGGRGELGFTLAELTPSASSVKPRAPWTSSATCEARAAAPKTGTGAT